MGRPIPRKIVIEFDGGAKRESSFESLPGPLQFELLRQPFASAPSSDPAREKYLVLEWDDGWKEVVELDPACKGFSRYTVITRPEDVGRLAIHREDGYPELVEITRKPLNVSRMAVLVDTAETVRPKVDRSAREGKKVDHFHKLNQEGDARADLLDAFKKAAADEGIDPARLRSGDTATLRDEFEKIRRRMGLRAGQRQQDVWDFIAYLASQ